MKLYSLPKWLRCLTCLWLRCSLPLTCPLVPGLFRLLGRKGAVHSVDHGPRLASPSTVPSLFPSPEEKESPFPSPEGKERRRKANSYAFLSFGVFSCGASLPRPAPWRSEHAETKWSRTEGRSGGDAKPETLRKEVVEENNVRATPSKKPLILLDGSPRRFQLELNINIVVSFRQARSTDTTPLRPRSAICMVPQPPYRFGE